MPGRGPGAGSGEGVPQRNTLSPSILSIGEGRLIAVDTAFSSGQSWAVFQFQAQAARASDACYNQADQDVSIFFMVL